MRPDRVAPRARIVRADEARRWIETLEEVARLKARAMRRLSATGRLARIVASRERRLARQEGEAEAARTVGAFLAEVARERAALADILPALVADGVRSLIGEVDIAEANLARAVTRALDEHLERGPARLRVSPTTAERLAEHLPPELAERLAIEPDEELADERATLHFADAIVEASLEAQIETLREGLAAMVHEAKRVRA